MKNYYLVADFTEKGITVVDEQEFAEYAVEQAKNHFYNAHLPMYAFDVPIKTVVVEVSLEDVDKLREELKRENLIDLGIQKKSSYRKQKWAELVESGKTIHVEE